MFEVIDNLIVRMYFFKSAQQNDMIDYFYPVKEIWPLQMKK